ncbi:MULTISPECIES: hypothetical protein [unclassified Flavobacterium]|uniref:hypothetical protein n=1 Tax=unclassified Flavobacterium TaxID=196869 RepID=UPI00131B2A75|nr:MULTISPECIES: hypothetical protein [unclassified Flavobacterium]
MNLQPFLDQLNSAKVKTIKETTFTALFVVIAASVEIISDWANFMAGLMGTLPNNHSKMKLPKNFYLFFGIFFTINLIYSLIEIRDTYELFSFPVNIWVYRGYRLFIAVVFIMIYFKMRANDMSKLNQ